MFHCRIAVAFGAWLSLCAGAYAQDRIVSFNEAVGRGALSEVVHTPRGCTVLPLRDGTPLQASALVDIDCRGFTASGTLDDAITVRLFTRMVLNNPWLVKTVIITYQASTGGDATVTTVRPAPGVAANSIRNPWVEFSLVPRDASAGTVVITLTASPSMALLPPPLPNCDRGAAGGATSFRCSTDADCDSAHRCAAECNNTCVSR